MDWQGARCGSKRLPRVKLAYRARMTFSYAATKGDGGKAACAKAAWMVCRDLALVVRFYKRLVSIEIGYVSFQGITLRSISWNSAAVTRPSMPITTMPTNM